MFDIFSADSSVAALRQQGAGRGGGKKPGGGGGEEGGGALVEEGDDHTLSGNWDDAEGYYRARSGELIGDRYKVQGEIGRGVFATVLRAVDERVGRPVAIKMIRNNETMRKAAQRELELLLEIAAHDPENKKHCVRLIAHSEHRAHTALVFESLEMNLRQTIKKFGKNIGINVKSVRTYSRQLFAALKHLASRAIVHADIKPDNILVGAGLSTLKLCDFGSAFKETDPGNDPTPYLVSRFYRAVEIMLALPYDRQIDTWSIGTCLFELFTGRVMFAGSTNNDMIRIVMEYKGRLPNKMVKRHLISSGELMLEPHFEEDLKFRQHDVDKVTGRPVLRLVEVTKPTRDLEATLLGAKAPGDDRRLVLQLLDLLDKATHADPTKRITARDACHHPFLTADGGAVP